MEIKKVLKQGNKKIVIIPKNSPYPIGEYVKISSMNEKEVKKSGKKLMEELYD